MRNITFFIFLLLVIIMDVNAQDMANSKVFKINYEYKKYEKFDFSELSIDAGVDSVGDISILSRYQKRYSNKLPYRTNFNPEIIRGIEIIR